MTRPRVLGYFGVVVMVLALVSAFTTGSFADEGSQLMDLPWGRMSLIDLYVGVILVGGWIAHRERNWRRTLMWWAGLFVFGHLASAAYVVWAARSSTWPAFWSGSHTQPSTDNSAAR